MDKLNEQQLQELKEKHKVGEIYEIEADGDGEDGGDIVLYFKKPSRPQLSRFAKEVMTDAMRAMSTLIFDCLVHPSNDAVKDLFARKPGMPIAVGNELQKIVGTNQSFLSHKL